MINNKGFSLLELLIVLFISTSLTIVTSKRFEVPNVDYIYLTNDIIESHVYALTHHELCNVLNKYTNDNIYFNGNGNINKAQTIDVSYRKIVLHLGNGYLVNE